MNAVQLVEAAVQLHADGNLNGALTFSAELGQSWTFEAEFLLNSNNAFNTFFSYGHYTDGVLLRSIRGDDVYVKGSHLASMDVFGGVTTNGEFVKVKVEFNTAGCEDKMRIYCRNNLIREVRVNKNLSPQDQTIRIGSAHHAINEGFDGFVRNAIIRTDGGSVRKLASQAVRLSPVCPNNIPVCPDNMSLFVHVQFGMEAKDTFSHMDKNKQGKLAAADICAMLSDMGFKDEEISNLILRLDVGECHESVL